MHQVKGVAEGVLEKRDLEHLVLEVVESPAKADDILGVLREDVDEVESGRSLEHAVEWVDLALLLVADESWLVLAHECDFELRAHWLTFRVDRVEGPPGVEGQVKIPDLLEVEQEVDPDELLSGGMGIRNFSSSLKFRISTIFF